MGWFCFKDGVDGSMIGAMTLRKCIFPLQSELEALIWVRHCIIAQQKTTMAFTTDCSEFVKMMSELVKMVSTPAEQPAFSIHMEEFAKSKELFTFFFLVKGTHFQFKY